MEDDPTVFFTIASDRGMEGESIYAQVGISAAPLPGKPVTVSIGSTLEGHNANNSDFELRTTSVGFGVGDDTPKLVEIALVDDEIP